MADAEGFSGLSRIGGLVEQDYTISQIRELLENTKWADTLSGKEVETLSRYLYVGVAEKGAVIVREGAREPYLCLLIEGRVAIMKEGPRHTTKRIGTAGAGSTFGEMSLIDGEPRSASVVADESTILVVFTGNAFNRLSSEVPRLAIKVLLKICKLISQRLRQTSGALVDHLGG